MLGSKAAFGYSVPVQALKRIFGNPHLLATIIALALGIAAFKKYRELDAPDFRVFYFAGELAVSTPEKLYVESPDKYLYPPVTSLLFSPFPLVADWPVARLAWYLLNIALLIFLLRRSLLHCLAGVILARYIMINFRYGQVNLLVLGLMAIAAGLARRERTSLSAIVIAINAMIKVFPGVQFFDLLLRRDKKAILTFCAAMAGLLLLPFAVWNFDVALNLYREFPAELAKKGIPSFTHNQSLLALLNRLFVWEKFYAFPVDDLRWRIVTLPDGLVKLFALALGAAVSAVVWFRAHQRNNPGDSLTATGFCILFLSHLVWKPYFVLLLPALVQVLEGRGRTHWTLFAGFILLGPLLSADIYGFYFATWMEGACTHLWAALLLLIAWYRLPSSQKFDRPHLPGQAGYTSSH